jgi:hypothetical protein
MEVRLAIDEKFMEALQQRLEESRATEVMRNALTLLDWAADEVRKGRVIYSSDLDGTDVHRLVMPILSKIVPVAEEISEDQSAHGYYPDSWDLAR